MKKIVLHAIAILLILCGCEQPAAKPADPTQAQTPTQATASTQPSETTTPMTPSNPTDTTIPTETTKPTETTTPTETAPKALAVADWQLEQPEYLSYEEYFSTEREFMDGARTTSWISGDQVYALQFVYERGKKVDLAVVCEETDGKYSVPNSVAYLDYDIAGADGKYGYLFNDSRFLRLDLAAGKSEELLSGQSFCQIYSFSPRSVYLLDNLVAYYASYANGELCIGRLYLPTQKNDILYKTQGEFYDISLNQPKTNKEPIVWTLKNPEFVNYLKAELADPNSKIQKGEYYDYSERWKESDAFSTIIKSPMHLHYLQDAGNQRALLKCTLDITTKELTQQTGIIDSCFHGSGYPHDHYNTDVTTAPAPEVIMSEWRKIDQEVPFALLPTTDDSTVDDRIVKVTDVDSNMYLYAKTDGNYKKIVNVPIRMAVDTGTCAIYITADKKSVVAVSYDGTQSVELYRAVQGGVDYIRLGEVELKTDGVRNGLTAKRFVLRDGNTLVQIDLENQQYRELVKHPDLQGYQFDCGFGDVVYFEVYVGLYVSGYTIDLQTGELREKGYFL
ncbi:MAG: hypothetical protein IJX37_03105 [Oscillospiraceae bacterium]|nr:hypothetical protein [Oscillospiraceae bacterium]